MSKISVELDITKIKNLIERALYEDIGAGDITTDSLIAKTAYGTAIIISRDYGILSGLAVAREVFLSVDVSLSIEELKKDGDRVYPDDGILKIRGRMNSILKAERTALNFLSHLSGISTLTAKFVEKVKGYPVKIRDTRKTTPCLRILEKYAVTMGGGSNHRMGLYDGILIKDNHIKLKGGVKNALEDIEMGEHKVEIEVSNLKEVKEALEAGVDIIMLDNMSIEDIKKAVSIIGEKAEIEVSGSVTLENIEEIAKTGVDYISVGLITHSADSLDLSLEVKECRRV